MGPTPLKDFRLFSSICLFHSSYLCSYSLTHASKSVTAKYTGIILQSRASNDLNNFALPLNLMLSFLHYQYYCNTLISPKYLQCNKVAIFTVSGTYLWTKRGGKHPLLLLEGYTFSFQKQNADGRVSWYCSRRLKGCRASAISFGAKAITHKPHDHPPPKLPDNILDMKPQEMYMFPSPSLF